MKPKPSIKMLENRRQGRLKALQRLSPFLTDSFCLIGRKCGNLTCACVTGEKHPAWIVTYKEKGKTRSLYVPVDLVPVVSKWAKEAKWLKQQIQEINQIQKDIIRQYVATKRAGKKGKQQLHKILENS